MIAYPQTVYAIHGFLGQPTNWDFLPFKEIQKIDLFNEKISPFWEWADIFNQRVRWDGRQHRTLIGYSLGGRLALHALLAAPELWEQAILISTHCGLSCSTAKRERLQADKQWAERFLQDPWDDLMKDWNAQPIFHSKPHKLENTFNRYALADALTTWSLGNQDNLIEKLPSLSVPICWIAGGKDIKFTELAISNSQHSRNGRCLIIPDAGHRVPWEQSDKMLEYLFPKS